MRALSNIKQDIKSTEQRLTGLRQELHAATIIGYACVITPQKCVMAPISSEVLTKTDFGMFTYHPGLDFFYFHESEHDHDMVLYRNAARFELDAGSFTWHKPNVDDGYPFPKLCPCTVALWRSRDKAE
jgi:hypothetical protein